MENDGVVEVASSQCVPFAVPMKPYGLVRVGGISHKRMAHYRVSGFLITK